MRIGAFITVRTGSSRLPQKCLLKLKGKTMIEHLIEWIKRSKKLDEIILCTTPKGEDDILIEIAKEKGIQYFRGSENDIVQRHLGAAGLYNIDFIINIDGDNIFYPAEYIDIMSEMARKNTIYDVIYTSEENGLPYGTNVFGYKRESLEKIHNKSSETGWGEILRNEPTFNRGFISILPEHKVNVRLTVDYIEDFKLFEAIYDHFESDDFTFEDVISLLKQKPELIEINRHCETQYFKDYNRKKLKCVIIGLGSMGKRRIRNLKALGIKNIVGFDIKTFRDSEFGIKTYSLLRYAMKHEPDIMIISTPPDRHLYYQKLAIEKNIPFFTEASVINEGLPQITWEMKRLNDVIGMPSCTMRFHPAIKKIKELIDTNRIGKPLTFTYHSGSFLPEWHPNDDPKHYYAYDKKQGAAKEMVPFALVWLTWIFGNVKSVKAYYKETMNWGIDDIYQILIEFESGVIGHLLVDVVSREWIRRIEIMGSIGILRWDWNKKRVELLEKSEYNLISDDLWHYYPYDKGTPIEGYNENIMEEMYIDELDHFIKVVQGLEEPIYTLEDDLKILKILEEIEENGSMDKS